MRFATVVPKGNATPVAAVFNPKYQKYYVLESFGLSNNMAEAIVSLGQPGKQDLFARSVDREGVFQMFGSELYVAHGIPISEINLSAPVLTPAGVYCIGKNYKLHVQGGGETAMPPEPIIFSKCRGSIVGPGQDIIVRQPVKFVDYEAELVVVIGKECRDVPEEEAMNCIFGYTCGNDVSARCQQIGPDPEKWGQEPVRQWLRGKSFDTFAPIGPWIVTADEFANPMDRRVYCRRNSRIVQDSFSKGEQVERMHFGIPKIISYLSESHTLYPGDLIFTGTPSGTIMESKEKLWLADGETVTVGIEGIGELTNTVRFVRRQPAS